MCITAIYLCSQNLNKSYDADVPLVLMNSFNTDDDTEKAAIIEEIKAQQAPSKGNLMALFEELVKADIGGSNRDAIGKYLEQCVDEAPDTTICKLQSVREDNKIMICMSLRWLPIRESILDAFKQIKCPVRSEMPPPSVAEDTVSAYLDALLA